MHFSLAASRAQSTKFMLSYGRYERAEGMISMAKCRQCVCVCSAMCYSYRCTRCHPFFSQWNNEIFELQGAYNRTIISPIQSISTRSHTPHTHKTDAHAQSENIVVKRSFKFDSFTSRFVVQHNIYIHHKRAYNTHRVRLKRSYCLYWILNTLKSFKSLSFHLHALPLFALFSPHFSLLVCSLEAIASFTPPKKDSNKKEMILSRLPKTRPMEKCWFCCFMQISGGIYLRCLFHCFDSLFVEDVVRQSGLTHQSWTNGRFDRIAVVIWDCSKICCPCMPSYAVATIQTDNNKESARTESDRFIKWNKKIIHCTRSICTPNEIPTMSNRSKIWLEYSNETPCNFSIVNWKLDRFRWNSTTKKICAATTNQNTHNRT